MTESVFVAIIAGVIGLLIGSFLNVVIHRVPAGLSVLSPPSACPRCKARVRPYDNIPVLSWLILKGKCRDCQEPISARYPVVELSTALIFALVGWHFGLSWTLPAYLYAAGMAIALTMIDIDVHRLPDAIVFPSYAIVAVLLIVASWGTGDWSALLRAVLGGLILFVAYFIMMIIYPSGMGAGDVKLAGILGGLLAWIGWGTLAIGGFAAFLFGGLFAIVLLVGRRANRKSGIPFGPWMLLGAAFAVGFGEPIWRAYLDTFT